MSNQLELLCNLRLITKKASLHIQVKGDGRRVKRMSGYWNKKLEDEVEQDQRRATLSQKWKSEGRKEEQDERQQQEIKYRK